MQKRSREHRLRAEQCLPLAKYSVQGSLLTPAWNQVERRALDYLCPNEDFTHDAFISGPLRKDLTRSLGKMQPAMFEDIRCTVDDVLGRDTDVWNQVRIKEWVEKVTFRASLRVLLGSPLCENEDFISSIITFSNWMGGSTIVVGQMPWIMKASFGYLWALPVYYYRQKAMKYLLPVVRARFSNVKRKRDDPSFNFEAPGNMITWMIETSLENPDTKDNPPEYYALRLLLIVS